MSTSINVYHRLVLIEKYLFEEKPKTNVVGSANIEYEPKRKSRFVVEFPDDFELPSYLVSYVTKPKLNIHYEWCDMEIRFIDIIGPSTSHKLYELAKICLDKKKLHNEDSELFNFSIFQLDPTGIRVEQWIIEVKDIEINFGNLDYSSDELSEVKMKIIPRDCILVS
jgi:hypothetical protein